MQRSVVALASLVGMGWAADARAFCREVTVEPPANYEPVEAGCFTRVPDGGQALPTLFWRNQCVGYSLQKDASPKYVSLDAARTVASQAFQRWTNAACAGGVPSIFASELPPVDCSDPRSVAHNNPIIFRDSFWPHGDQSNSLGFTTLTVRLSTGEILGAAIEINSAQNMIVAQGPVPDGAYDLSSILTHEAGHFLGLAHSDTTDAVMYTHYQPGTSALRPDDVNGVCTIYSPDGMRSTLAGEVASMTCSPQPPGGYSTECGTLDGGIVGDPGDAGGEPFVCVPPDPYSCSVGHAYGQTGSRGLAACSVALIVWLARRRSGGPRRRAHDAARIGGMVLAVVSWSSVGAHRAEASVSIAAGLTDLVHKASAVIVATPTEQRAVWEGDRIATYTRVRIARAVAGRPAADAWIRTLGGAVGDIAQLVEGEATFAADTSVLVFIRPWRDPATGEATGVFSVVDGAQGEFPVVAAADRPPRLALAKNAGALVPPAATAGLAPRSARDVLDGRSLDDAVREVANLWRQLHP